MALHFFFTLVIEFRGKQRKQLTSEVANCRKRRRRRRGTEEHAKILRMRINEHLR